MVHAAPHRRPVAAAPPDRGWSLPLLLVGAVVLLVVLYLVGLRA